MRRCFKILYVAVLLLFSCTTEEPNPTIIDENQFKLTSQITGTWTVENSKNTVTSQLKKREKPCQITSFTFNPDKTFSIEYKGGNLIGYYEVIDENTINLHSNAVLGSISFIDGAISYYIELTDICNGNIEGNLIRTKPRECSTFLECNDSSIWISNINGNSSFLNFINTPEEVWLRAYNFQNEETCYKTITNQQNDGMITLIKNNPELLKLIYESLSGNEIHTYRINEDGSLTETIETIGDISSYSYQPTSKMQLDEMLLLPSCEEKTYIPDEVFEQNLINSGLDDIIDKYVLTGNIINLEHLGLEGDYFGNEITEMTGLQDFVSLKSLNILSKSLTDIDLSGNFLLEVFWFMTPNLQAIDLSNNLNLKRFLFEKSEIKEIDLTQNKELNGFELIAPNVKSLDISENINLKGFQFDASSLETITTSFNPNLIDIRIYGYGPRMPLANIDVSVFPNIEYLGIWNSSIDQIDVSFNQSLIDLFIVDSNIIQLDISSNLNVRHFSSLNNQNLNCIKVEEIHLTKIEEFPFVWEKDHFTKYSLNCNY